MTTLEKVIERLRALPEHEREDRARQVDRFLDETDDFTPEQMAELDRREAGPDDYATDKEVEAFFARHEK